MSGRVAVFDVGKTNVKLSVAEAGGRLLETVAAPNASLPGPPYRHHDLDALEGWLVEGLRDLGSRHPIEAVVATGHGSGGVLVGADGPLMPMIDYEQPVPAAVDAAYREVAGPFAERGSPIMLGATHLARQMLWLEAEWPDAFAAARAYLAVPQYWAWRLSGVLASEVTSLAAQSHLWCAPRSRWSALVERRGWGRLLPQLTPAWQALGPLRPALRERTGLGAGARVLCGIHDSSANLYGYGAAGLSDVTVVSTGTWIAAISDRAGADLTVERPGLTANADVRGAPLPGMLTMGGREYSAVAAGATAPASADGIAALVASGTMALPSFGHDDGLFPGTARTGRLAGPLAGEAGLSASLAVLYAALLTEACLGAADTGRVVLDGSFARDPLYAATVAALVPGRQVASNLDPYGVATGTALLAGHQTRTAPAPLTLQAPPPLTIPGLPAYRDRWRALAQTRRTA